MARRRRSKKKSLSGLGALALDPKIMLGGLVLIGVAAYFLLKPKDADADTAVPPSGDFMPPSDGSQMMPESSTGTPAPAPAPLAPMQLSPAAQSVLREKVGPLALPGLLSPTGRSPTMSAGAASALQNLRNRRF